MTRKYTCNNQAGSRMKELWSDSKWRAKTIASIQAAADRRKKRNETLMEAAGRLGVWNDATLETREEKGRHVRKSVDGLSNKELDELSDKGSI